jgi:hypothetical protein
MRANKVMNYESILQVLGEPGCPFCRFMKNFQSGLLQDPGDKEIHHLCNFHTWGLAATQRAVSAAQLFINLLKKQQGPASCSSCDICVLLQMEEERRMREFLSCAQHKQVAQWFRTRPVLCWNHGSKLKEGAPPALAVAIGNIVDTCRHQLIEELVRLHDEYQPERQQWGLLGHAAEFLVSQRGLHA